jgi:homocysteine S-methyltransferase
MAAYFDRCMDTAEALGLGFMLDTATWRASHGWGAKLGLSAAEIARFNADAVGFARKLKTGRAAGSDIIINGAIGPFGDAYAPDRVLSVTAAHDYHLPQARALAEAGAEMITAVTMTHPNEAIGIARAAQDAGLPVALGFTVETDGRLVTGLSLGEAIAQAEAATGGYAAWYMINCAHPDHFIHSLKGKWIDRIGAIRANASRMSHAELDNATVLDPGDAAELAQDYRRLQALLPNLRVLGGCCGTDDSHIHAIGHACHRHAHAA